MPEFNVLSLFDGCSCGQQALDRLGIKVDNYFASEIDKYAIQATMANYPNTRQLGSVVDVDGYSLPQIDLLCGGSPCQSFSFAGKRKGMSTKDEQEVLTLEHYLQLKSEGYEFEGQSYLFWEFMRLLKETKPRYFLLENVMMGEKWEKILTKAIGVNPIEINSSLVSAQSRRRLYWTNIGMAEAGLFGDMESYIPQPKDRKIFLRDILQKDVAEKYFLSDLALAKIERHNNDSIENEKSNTIHAGYFKGGGRDQQYIADSKKDGLTQIGNIYDNEHNSVAGRIYTDTGKSVTLSALGGGGGAKTGLYAIPRLIAHDIPEMVSVRKHEVDIPGLQALLKEHKGNITIRNLAEKLRIPKTEIEHWFRTDASFSIPSPEYWMKLKEILSITTDKFDAQVMEFIEKESVFEKTNRVYDEDGLAPTLTSTGADERILVREIRQLNPSKESGRQPYQQNRVYDINGISPTLDLDSSRKSIYTSDFRIRRLTPIECCRLQTVKDDYFFKDGKYIISETRVYQCLGNGWTIEVISHLFSYMVL